VLGIVFPKGKTFLDEGWGAVVTYEPAGYITDKDAGANYDEYLDEIRKDEDEGNAERKKAGFEPVHLVGWAQPPTYDPVRHHVIWARDLKFGDEPDDVLNYDVRLLGRRGFLSLNLVSKMSRLSTVRADAKTLADDASFNPGSTYADYQPGSDAKAAYGVAGLVAAGLGVAAAQKFGLLALIALFAKKFIVLIVAAGAAIAGWFRRLLKRKPKTSDRRDGVLHGSEHPAEAGLQGGVGLVEGDGQAEVDQAGHAVLGDPARHDPAEV
jgi:uncharacterized membrane-anchored protein